MHTANVEIEFFGCAEECVLFVHAYAFQYSHPFAFVRA